MRIDGRMPVLRADWVLAAITLVVFVLITIFGVTPAIAGHTRLPAARMAVPIQPGGGAVTVGVDRNGQVWIVDAHQPGPVAPSRLRTHLREVYAARGTGPAVLHLHGDRHAPYAPVAAVLRAASELGVRDVVLIAECPRGTESLLRECHTHPSTDP